jgi:hypothetical protein
MIETISVLCPALLFGVFVVSAIMLFGFSVGCGMFFFKRLIVG